MTRVIVHIVMSDIVNGENVYMKMDALHNVQNPGHNNANSKNSKKFYILISKKTNSTNCSRLHYTICNC